MIEPNLRDINHSLGFIGFVLTCILVALVAIAVKM